MEHGNHTRRTSGNCQKVKNWRLGLFALAHFKYSILLDRIGEVMLQVQHACFNDFPDQCTGCPDYSETKMEPLSQYTWLAGMVTMYPPHFVSRVVKECRRYHKRIVEYPQEREA